MEEDGDEEALQLILKDLGPYVDIEREREMECIGP